MGRVHRQKPPTDVTIVELLYAQRGKCFYCRQPFSQRRRPTRDHLFPKAMGCSLVGNKVMAHAVCNQTKGNRLPTPEEYERAVSLYAGLGATLSYRLLRVIGPQPGYVVVYKEDL